MTTATEVKAAPKKVRIPAKVAKGSLAGRIRFLDEKGMARADIARQLGVRYQRVRNVLVPRVKAADIESEVLETEADVEEQVLDTEVEAAS
jgi:hypothetical protein